MDSTVDAVSSQENALMDSHQRSMWESMLAEIERFQAGQLSLSKLVANLRGLYVEADPHDSTIRAGFEAVWSPIDGENDLRTQSWAPPGLASEDNLVAELAHFSEWVEGVLAADQTEEHG
jgi:hypothetical protein